jgi:lysozyme
MKRQIIKRESYIEGIDVSKWQNVIDWTNLDPSVEFAIARAAYGIEQDKRFKDYWTGMRDSKVIRGVYQYVTASTTGANQALAMCRIIKEAGGLDKDDLPPVIDVEFDPEVKKWPKDRRLPLVTQWCKVIRNELGRVPIVYTGPYYWQDTVTIEPMPYPLWISHYDTFAPLVPDSWPVWTIWQYTSNGKAKGIDGAVDRNVFDGSKEDLLWLTRMLTEDVYWQNTMGERP